MTAQIALLIGREIANAMNENRETITVAMTQHLKSIGETASSEKFTVRNLNATQVLIEGEGVTEQAMTYLRGAGFDVLHSGNIAVAKDNNTKRKLNSTRGGAGAEKVSELRYYNDDKSIRDARKMFQNLVEAKDWRYFPQFLKDLDNVVANARMREGHTEDDDANDGSTAENTERKHAPIMKNDDKGRAVAGVEEEPTVVINDEAAPKAEEAA